MRRYSVYELTGWVITREGVTGRPAAAEQAVGTINPDRSTTTWYVWDDVQACCVAEHATEIEAQQDAFALNAADREFDKQLERNPHLWEKAMTDKADKTVPLSEAALSKKVIKMARHHGWRVAHFHRAPTPKGYWGTPIAADGRGFPDLVLTRERVLFVELKSEGKYPDPNQREWIAKLSSAGAEVYVWRPSDLLSGEIEFVLELKDDGE